jgi:hypothetical protein
LALQLSCTLYDRKSASSIRPATKIPLSITDAPTISMLCGLAGAILGILALLRLDPATFLASAVIVVGGALLMASEGEASVNAFGFQGPVSRQSHEPRLLTFSWN